MPYKFWRVDITEIHNLISLDTSYPDKGNNKIISAFPGTDKTVEREQQI